MARFLPRQLPPEQPDKCETCPLVGIIPPEEQRSGVRERYYCLGVYEAMTDEDGNPICDEHGTQLMSFPRIKSKGLQTSAKKVREGGHLLHRPCDYLWDAWMTLPGRLYGMPTDTYTRYRLPYELEQQIKNQPRFKFKRTGRS